MRGVRNNKMPDIGREWLESMTVREVSDYLNQQDDMGKRRLRFKALPIGVRETARGLGITLKGE
jgi:hypothetical protein